MPLLFYGSTPKRKLYGVSYQLIETSVFDNFKRKDLEPSLSGDSTAIAWHLDNSHSALSWRGNTVYIPGLLSQQDMVTIARVEFGDFMPGSLTFRIYNENNTYWFEGF